MGTRKPPAILVVCRANVCRSPTAAVLLRRRLSDHARLEVASAGWSVGEAQGWCTESMTLVEDGPDIGEVLTRHRSRPVTRAALEQTPLVLAADRRARSELTKQVPRGSGRIFTLVEAAVLAEAAAERTGSTTIDLGELVEEMHALRGLVDLPEARRSRLPGRSSLGIDVPDAHSLDRPVSHGVTVRALTHGVDRLAAVIAAVLPPTAAPVPASQRSRRG